jgi:hypothetical protein
MQRVSLSLLILLAYLVAAGPVYAGTCSNPAGKEADIQYNGDFHTYQFCNGSNWMAYGAIGSTGGLYLISTQTASASASLQFTSLPTSYNTLFLNCSDLIFSNSSAARYFRVGEGAGPTWESGAHYTFSVWWTDPGSNGFNSNTTAVDITRANPSSSTTVPFSMKLYIDNVSSSTVYKNVTWNYAGADGSNNYFAVGGTSFWNSDTNPITGLEVVPSVGTITSGQCSPYGMN